MKPSIEPAGEAMLAALRAKARGRGAVGFDEFMEVALYDPAAGYYRRDAARIGYGRGTDFLTATASAPLFGRLVAEACAGILAPRRASEFTFVEVGAERGSGVLSAGGHPFGSMRLVGAGEAVRLAGPSVVFSNELFDAQPFRRFRYRDGAWRELGVRLDGGVLAEAEIAAAGPLPRPLPGSAPEGYVIDAPFAAAALCRAIAGQAWSGLFVAFDYGKPWEEIAHATPQGTARAYHRHIQGNALLERPGEQDLTCHVCWDWLRDELAAAGFRTPVVESQEAFFMGRAAGLLGSLASAGTGPLGPEAMALRQLLHPANLGQRFQVLWALRSGPKNDLA